MDKQNNEKICTTHIFVIVRGYRVLYTLCRPHQYYITSYIHKDAVARDFLEFFSFHQSTVTYQENLYFYFGNLDFFEKARIFGKPSKKINPFHKTTPKIYAQKQSMKKKILNHPS